MSVDGLKRVYKYRWTSLCGNVFGGMFAHETASSFFVPAGMKKRRLFMVTGLLSPYVMKGVYMGAFSEGFIAGLANPKASRGIAQAGSAFYDWMQGIEQKSRADEEFDKAMRDYDVAPRNGNPGQSKDPFGYFDQGGSGGGTQADPQGPDRAQIESEKMLKELEKGIQKFMDSGNPRHNPQQFFNGQVAPRGRHVDPTYDRRR